MPDSTTEKDSAQPAGAGPLHPEPIKGRRVDSIDLLRGIAIAVILHAAFGKPVRWLFQTPVDWFTNPPQGNGFSLIVVYLSWIAGVLLLYPLCKWFAAVKARRRDWWLSYM